MAQSVEKLTSELAVTHYDFDPGATTATEIDWVDMRDHCGILVSFFRTIGTGAVTFKIMANTASDGSGTDADIVTHAVSSEPDAVGDYIFLECTAEQIAAAGADMRYVTAVVSVATGTDEGVITYIRKGKRQYSGLTADVIA